MRRDDPLYRIRRIALAAAERFDQRGWERLLAGLELGDPDCDLVAAWLAAQKFRKVYAAGNNSVRTRNARLPAVRSFFTTPPCATPSTAVSSPPSRRSHPNAVSERRSAI